MRINNKEELIEKLTEILMDFDKQHNSYHTDVYMYYDHVSKTAELDTFVNVGNNSWIDDNHWTIYTDEPHNEDFENYFNELGFIADIIGITTEQLKNEAKAAYGYEPDDDISDLAVFTYVYQDMENQGYQSKLIDEYSSYIEANRNDYEDKAEHIIDEIERTPYFRQFDDYNGYPALIGTLEASDKVVDKLNKFIGLYDEAKGGLPESEIKEYLEDEGVIIHTMYYAENVDEKKLDNAIKSLAHEKDSLRKIMEKE